MKLRNLAVIGLMFSLLLSAFMVPAVNAIQPETGSSSGPYPAIFSASVNYRSSVITNQNIHVYVNATYGFSNYNLTVYFAGENMTGFQPTDSFHQFSASSPYFIFNITAPSTPQTVFMHIVVTASNGTGTLTYSTQNEITVYSPIVLYAAVTNSGPVPLYNLTLQFFIDGSQRSTVTIPVIASHRTVKVNTTVVPVPALSKGKHTVTVKVSGNNPLVLINGEQATSYSSSFYYGTPPNYTWIYYIAAAVVVFMAFLVFASGRRAPAGAMRPKWRK